MQFWRPTDWNDILSKLQMDKSLKKAAVAQMKESFMQKAKETTENCFFFRYISYLAQCLWINPIVVYDHSLEKQAFI